MFFWACAWVTATVFTLLWLVQKTPKKLFNMRDFSLGLKASQKRVFRGHLVSVNSYKKFSEQKTFVFKFYTKKVSCVISVKVFIAVLPSAQVYANRMHTRLRTVGLCKTLVLGHTMKTHVKPKSHI